MEFTYRDKKYTFPSSLEEIKLGQRIEFDRQYGAEIKSIIDEVYQNDENGKPLPVDEDAAENLNLKVAIMNFSFFTGISMKEIEAHIPIDQVASIFFACFQQLYSEQDSIKLEKSYEWNGETWHLEDPELTFESGITFNQLITSKQITKQKHEAESGNWEAVRSLAAVYLLRKNEKFNENWLNEGSDRLKMMDDLPMTIAMHVGFFLRSSMILFQITLPSFQEVEMEEKVLI